MKILASYSIKGGVGKSALAVNLAFHLRSRGLRLLLVDLDPQGAAAFYFRVGPAGELPGEGDLTGDWLRENLRESDFPGLDILPSSLAYRNLDLRLADARKPRKQLRRVLDEVRDQYDIAIIDSPPNITLLSENIFRAAHGIVVPVIPTTLSARTLTQLDGFFRDEELDPDRLAPFFSMVQSHKRLHRDLITELRSQFPNFLQTEIPFSVDVENMGIERMPLLASHPDRPSALAYHALGDEIVRRFDLLP